MNVVFSRRDAEWFSPPHAPERRYLIAPLTFRWLAQMDDLSGAEGEWRKNDETGELQFHAADGSVVTQQEWADTPSTDSEGTEA